MVAPEASVHPVRNCLSPFTKQTKVVPKVFQEGECCSRSFNKSCLRVTAPNVTEAERPSYERSRIVLHVTRRLLLQLLASVLSSRVRLQILDSSYQFNLCSGYY